MRTSIVIPVHNELACTQVCLEALEYARGEADLDVIVVDNGSSDGTPEWLDHQARQWPYLRVIRSPQNLGFAGGCNLGLAAATGDGVVLLNNDAIVTPGWLQGLWQPLLASAAIGMTGPVSNFVIREQRVPGPETENWQGVLAHASRFAASQAGLGQPTERLSGFCLMIRRAVIDRLGGLDTRFGLGYCEDDDYCLRAGLAGFRLWIVREVYVHHLGQRTSATLGLATGRFDGNWSKFRTKWGLPPERVIQQGWRLSDVPPTRQMLDQVHESLPVVPPVA